MPNTSPQQNAESAIAELAAELRSLHEGDTRRMVRELATALFYKFGEKPTPSRVYSLLKKGSMTTIQAAMEAFWADIRKSGARINRPDLPEPILVAFGDAAATAWRLACDQAEANYALWKVEAQRQLATAQAEATNSVAAARQLAIAAQADANAAHLDAARSHGERRAAEDRVTKLAANLATVEEALSQTKTQLRETAARGDQERASAAQLQKDLMEQIGGLQTDRQRDREMIEGLRKKSLADIEEARAEVRRVREDLKSERAESGRTRAHVEARCESQATELASLKETANKLRQQVEAGLTREDALKEDRDRLRIEIGAMRSQLDALLIETGRLQKVENRLDKEAAPTLAATKKSRARKNA